MTPQDWRRLGYRVERQKRPLSRGTVYRVFHVASDHACGTAYSRAELDCLFAEILGGPAFRTEVTMPGARAAIVRPARRYL
jgi:hypothetical protein